MDPTSLSELLARAAAGFASVFLFVGLVIWIGLGVATLVAARPGGLARSPRIVVVPSASTRGLSALGIVLALLQPLLTAAAFAANDATLDAPALSRNLTIALVFGVIDLIALALVWVYAVVLVRVRCARGESAPAVGLELVFAYALTIAVNVMPLASILALAHRNGTF